MQFKQFGVAVARQFQSMTATGLFRTAADKDVLWETYLNSFPPGSNPIYKQRTDHDCCACRHFIKMLGGVVTVVDNELLTIWDVAIGEPYRTVAAAMATYVRSQVIENIFLHIEPVVGLANTHQLLEDNTVKTWDHFFVNLPANYVAGRDAIGPRLSDARATYDVLLRGLTEITLNAVDTVLELIAQNSLYRGEEQQFAVSEFRKLKVEFEQPTSFRHDLYTWARSVIVPAAVARIRNTAIGTLLAPAI